MQLWSNEFNSKKGVLGSFKTSTLVLKKWHLAMSIWPYPRKELCKISLALALIKRPWKYWSESRPSYIALAMGKPLHADTIYESKSPRTESALPESA